MVKAIPSSTAIGMHYDCTSLALHDGCTYFRIRQCYMKTLSFRIFCTQQWYYCTVQQHHSLCIRGSCDDDVVVKKSGVTDARFFYFRERGCTIRVVNGRISTITFINIVYTDDSLLSRQRWSVVFSAAHSIGWSRMGAQKSIIGHSFNIDYVTLSSGFTDVLCSRPKETS